jgi:putative oxygen-independent coproporphyrinogen III oxidase
MSGVRHLYLHLPFCAHRCGYCDFVTAVGREDQHEVYVDALLAELELERSVLAPRLETVFLGGGTPTFTAPAALERLLASLPDANEVTVEANPETVTPALARLLSRNRVNRVSLGAQSFQPGLLDVLERRAGPDDVRRAVYVLRDAGFDNISLDLLYGIPGQSPSDLDTDLAEALALEPEHLSCYELEAKPGTRFTHAHGAELERQAESMESYFERVVATLTGAGYRWYETANFCRLRGASEQADGRDLRARHNLAYWLGRDYLGLGIGAVSTIPGFGGDRALRRRNTPNLGPYLAALAAGQAPPRELEPLDSDVRRRERLLLGLRLDEPLVLAGLEPALDPGALGRLERLGLAARSGEAGAETLTLTERGRFLGGGVTAELLA